MKAFLLKCFQPRDLPATYKTQFSSQQRRHDEDIYTFSEALQRLADMAWPWLIWHGQPSARRACGESVFDEDGQPQTQRAGACTWALAH